MTIIGIGRERLYSPGRGGADAAIFSRVTTLLRGEGFDVVHLSEEMLRYSDTLPKDIVVDAIFSMARSTEALNSLMQLQDRVPIVNNPAAVFNCRPANFYSLFCSSKFSPWGRVIETISTPEGTIPLPCWLKCADSHSIYENDVILLNNVSDIESHLRVLRARGIERVLLQENIEGVLVKFYGVKRYGIIDYSIVKGTDKFGRAVSAEYEVEIDKRVLDQIAAEASHISGCDIYGGDVVVTPLGGYYLIDFNDWPSFGSCLDRAAEMIAESITYLL